MKIIKLICFISLLFAGCQSNSNASRKAARNEFYEKQAYRYVAAAYYQQLHPTETWSTSLNQVDWSMSIVKKFIEARITKKGL